MGQVEPVPDDMPVNLVQSASKTLPERSTYNHQDVCAIGAVDSAKGLFMPPDFRRECTG